MFTRSAKNLHSSSLYPFNYLKPDSLRMKIQNMMNPMNNLHSNYAKSFVMNQILTISIWITSNQKQNLETPLILIYLYYMITQRNKTKRALRSCIMISAPKFHESKWNITCKHTKINNSSRLFHPHMTRTIGFAVSKTATYLRTDLTRNNMNKN